MTAFLELQGLTRTFGALRAVDHVDLNVTAGARHALIGPNGAGKSTLLALVTGAVRPSTGDVLLAGRSIRRAPAHRRVRLGIAQTFQRSSPFPSMTALENIVLATMRAAGRAKRVVPLRRGVVERDAMAVLDQVGLAERARVVASELSHGERRQLELGTALACRPRLLLLDEPTAGVSPAETAQLVELLGSLPADVTVVLIEHDFDVVSRLASIVTVLHAGRILMTGTPDEVRGSDAVQEAYFGTAHDEELFVTSGEGGNAAP